jgi:hypothetical protein
MKSITIKVGQSAEYDVPVAGEPPPTCTWSFDGKPIDPNSQHAKVLIISNFYANYFIDQSYRWTMKIISHTSVSITPLARWLASTH